MVSSRDFAVGDQEFSVEEVELADCGTKRKRRLVLEVQAKLGETGLDQFEKRRLCHGYKPFIHQQ